MRSRNLVVLAILGVILAAGAAYVFGFKQKALPPAFSPAANPYEEGIYAQGILESAQTTGTNISIYPEVSGTVSRIDVKEGDTVHAGQALIHLEDSVQRSVVDQAQAQIGLARASLKTAEDSYQKLKTAYDLDPGSIAKETLDSAKNTVDTARANVVVAEKQHAAAATLLAKYQIKAMSSAKVLRINVAIGSFISAQGAYEPYTQQNQPIMVMGSSSAKNSLAVRCYVDEVLLQRLPKPEEMKAVMFIRGANKIQIPLTFTRIQPNVTPKIELSDQRQERVDVRVLPVFFSFDAIPGVTLYPGQLVDVYIGKTTDSIPPPMAH